MFGRRGRLVLMAALMLVAVTTSIVGCSAKPAAEKPPEGAKKEEPKPKIKLTLVTGSTGGTYYPVGTILAALWSDKLGASGISASAQSSGGTAENLNMIKTGEAQLAIAMTNLAWFNYKGIEQYKDKPNDKLRFLTALWPDVTQFVVTKASKINGIKDIKGKRFCVGAAGSGTEYSSRMILKVLGGLEFTDFKPEHLGYFESSAAMQNGQLDGFNAEGGVPTAAVSEIFASQTPVKLLEFSDEDHKKLSAEVPFYVQHVIPANTYKGQTQDVKTIGVKCALVCNSDLPEDVAYNLVKTLYDNLQQIKTSHKALEYLTMERALQGLPPIPLHPGAVKYFNEKGVKIPDELVPKK